jgi:hypothetical protein
MWASLSPPHTRLEEVERNSIFKYDYLHFNKQGGTKEFLHPAFSHEWAFEIYYEFHNWLLGQAHINSNNPPPDLKYPFRDFPVLATV